jgi:peptidoglycan hydrolase CwlO-like protein
MGPHGRIGTKVQLLADNNDIIRSTDAAKDDSLVVSRRGALRMAAAAATSLVAAGIPSVAHADTQSDLAAAQQKLDEANAQLDEIASEYEALSEQHAETLAQIDDVNAQIADTEQQIQDKEAEIEDRQSILSDRISSSYKGGNVELLDVLLSSGSFEELSSNIYYFNKIAQSDEDLINEVKSAKQELEDAKAQLEEEQAQLEELSSEEESQLADMSNKQQEAQDLIDSLDSQVSELMAQRDAELAAQAAASSAEHSSYSVPDTSGMSGTQAAVIAACYSTPSPGLGYCAAWVTNVFVNAGVGRIGGNACDMYSSWCNSSDRSYLQPGMIIAVSTHPHSVAGRIYGHVGIYIGGGTVMDNIGYIRQIGVDSWISYYSATVPARWGWLGGVVLT